MERAPLSLIVFSKLQRFWTGSQWMELVRGVNTQMCRQWRQNQNQCFVWADEGNDCILENSLLIKAACMRA